VAPVGVIKVASAGAIKVASAAAIHVALSGTIMFEQLIKAGAQRFVQNVVP
jgi:hypothetical protein